MLADLSAYFFVIHIGVRVYVLFSSGCLGALPGSQVANRGIEIFGLGNYVKSG